MIDVEKTIDLAAKEMERLRESDIVLKIPLSGAIQIVSQIQLALRHPENVGPNAVAGRRFCDAIIQLIAAYSATLADFCRLGYDPKYDERRPKK